MKQFEPSLQGLYRSLVLPEDVFDTILASNDEVDVCTWRGTSFVFQDTTVPVSPVLELRFKACMFSSDIIHNNVFLVLVTVPPFVDRFGIVVGVMFASPAGLAYTRRAVNPYTPYVWSILCDHVVLLDAFEVSIILTDYRSRDRFNLTLFGKLEDFVPIVLARPSDWFSSEFPWTIDTSFYFEAVDLCFVRGALHFGEVDALVVLFEYC